MAPSYKLKYTTTNDWSVSVKPALVVNEGHRINWGLETDGVPLGTEIYWRIVGNGIDSEDFSYDSINGKSQSAKLYRSSGSIGFDSDTSFIILQDYKTEGVEKFKIKVYSGAGNNLLVESPEITISDTSKKPVDDVALPAVTLAVSPAAVKEDGTQNLLYTLTRTGPTTSALTVNYTVGGFATLGTDYTIVGQTGTSSSRSVVFSAGSPTAIVTIDPTADSTVESDETVALTLATGTGYSIGTTAAVIGTITNDDAAPAAPTYTVIPSATTINEGQTLTTYISTTGVAPGTTLYYDCLLYTSPSPRD